MGKTMTDNPQAPLDLEALKKVASSATLANPGVWLVPDDFTVRTMNGAVVARFPQRADQDESAMYHVESFDPSTALALLATIAEQGKKIEALEGSIKHVAEQGLIEKQDAENLGTDEGWDWHRGYSAAIVNCRTALSQSEGER